MFDQLFIFAGFFPGPGCWVSGRLCFFFQGRVLGRLDTQLSSDIAKNRMPGDYTTELNGGYIK